jgi:hypothetical protein
MKEIGAIPLIDSVDRIRHGHVESPASALKPAEPYLLILPFAALNSLPRQII